MAVTRIKTVVGDVCNTELVGEFEIQVVVLSSATYLDTHIWVLVGVERTGIDVQSLVLDTSVDCQ